MKPAFQKDDALLADIREAVASRSRKLWWLGQSGFLIVQDGRALLLDPYLSDSLTLKYANTEKPHVRITERVIDPAQLASLGIIDIITSSHNHTDHLDAETLLPILNAKPSATLVLPEANIPFATDRLGVARASQFRGLDEGQSLRVSGMTFHGIASAHNTVERDNQGRCKFMGFVIEWNGLTIYHSGDTLLHDALVPSLARFNIDLALLPINGDRPERRVAGNLDGKQAALLASAIRATKVIPCHYDLFEFNTASTADFESECRAHRQACTVLRNGEGLLLQAQ